MAQSRQLAAIMFTDVVGYTSTMGHDDRRAFDILNKNGNIQKPIIERYQGQWIKGPGDGTMASFKSVSDAIAAAIEIQQACNAAGDFKLRIGIHQGEVVLEKDDVFGDGVNIAARIQAQATPGGIWISEAVHHNVSNRSDINTEYLKVLSLKNVKNPVRVYQVIAEGVSSVSGPTDQNSGMPTQGSGQHILTSEAIIKPLILSVLLLFALLMIYMLFEGAL